MYTTTIHRRTLVATVVLTAAWFTLAVPDADASLLREPQRVSGCPIEVGEFSAGLRASGYTAQAANNATQLTVRDCRAADDETAAYGLASSSVVGGSTYNSQVPRAAVNETSAYGLASSYAVGGSTYNSQVPRAAVSETSAYGLASSYAVGGSTYNSQVPRAVSRTHRATGRTRRCC
jgi:hypothetical protein